MKVKYSLGIGFAGAVHKETVDFPDGTTDEVIQEDYIQWRDNYIDGAWWHVEEDNGKGNK